MDASRRIIAFAVLILGVLILSPSAIGAPSRTGAVDLLILWDGTQVTTEQNPLELGAFLGTVRKGDRIGVLSCGESVRVAMPLRRVAVAESRSLAYQVVDALESGAAEVDLAAGLQEALTHLERDGDASALRAVVLIAGSGEFVVDDDSGMSDAGADNLAERLLSRLLLEEVILHAMIRTKREDRRIEEVAAAAGGHSLTAREGTDLANALSLVYESLQLAAIEMARQQPDEHGAPPDYSFLDEVRTIDEIESAMQARSTARAQNRAGEPTSPVSAGLLIVLVVLSALILALLVFLVQRTVVTSKPPTPRHAAAQDRISPSFSKLSLGLNQFTRIFDEAGDKLRILSLDLEDFGAESWEIEKRMLDSYVSVTDSLFLLIDHLEVQAQGGQASAEADWFLMRLRQILEDEGISEIAIRPGDEFDGRLCSSTGDREDAAAPGSVVEVVRKGYSRKHGPTGNELVLRQAEVIVSRGIGSVDGDASPEEE